MVSGLCDTLEQSAGTAFLLILNVHRLPPAFVENSKPIFLRIITTHSCHTLAMCISFNDTKSQPTIEMILTFVGALSSISLATERAPPQEIPLHTVLLICS